MNAHSLLVVDDEPAIRSLVARLAGASGCTVSYAGCAGEALDRMAASPAAVVLCDINMPDRSGLWLATQLRRQFPKTALVMMTGFGQCELEAGLKEGAMASLAKPFTREQLIQVLERAREWHLERAASAAWNSLELSLEPAALLEEW
jgi:putative two-component system response regulator